jgi:hypothetical protein
LRARTGEELLLGADAYRGHYPKVERCDIHIAPL